MDKQGQTAIFLMGPTASGKTNMAIQLAGLWPIDIISVDSGMVYRGLDIGTAKPTKEEQEEAPHQLIDLCDPATPYSAAQFRTDALAAIEHTLRRHRIPLLVGGSMLYFHVLKHGLAPLPRADATLRESMLKRAHRTGWQSLYDELKRVDPVSAARIHPNDPQRIQRALEIYWTTGETRTALWEQTRASAKLHFNILPIILAPFDRSKLHERIECRFQTMLSRGFLEEVDKLYQRKDLHLGLPALRAVGYRQAWQYLSGACSKDEMRVTSIVATRQLAKRQLTWLRRWENVPWVDSDHAQSLSQVQTWMVQR